MKKIFGVNLDPVTLLLGFGDINVGLGSGRLYDTLTNCSAKKPFPYIQKLELWAPHLRFAGAAIAWTIFFSYFPFVSLNCGGLCLFVYLFCSFVFIHVKKKFKN